MTVKSACFTGHIQYMVMTFIRLAFLSNHAIKEKENVSMP